MRGSGNRDRCHQHRQDDRDVEGPDEIARELVIVINDPAATERAIRAARRVAPDLYILARANYAADIESLLRAGASEVVSAELEVSAEITSRVLGRHHVRRAQVETELSRIRERRED